MASDQSDILILLESIDRAKSDLNSAIAQLERYETQATSTGRALDTATGKARQTKTAFDALGAAANRAGTPFVKISENQETVTKSTERTASGLKTFSGTVTATTKTLSAMQGSLLLIGGTAFPKVTDAAIIATSTLGGMRAAAAATGLSLGIIVAGAVLVIGAITAIVKSFQALNNARLEPEFQTQWDATIEKVKQLRNEGAISDGEYRKFGETLKEINETASKSISDATIKLTEFRAGLADIKGTTVIDQLGAKLAAADTDISFAQLNSGASPVASPAELDALERKGQLITSAVLAYQQEQNALAAKLKLDDQQLLKNKEFLDLEVKKQQEAQKGFDLQRQIAQKEREIDQNRLETSRAIFGNLATVAKAAGKEGFAAYKAFAIAEAVVAGVLATQKALAEGGPILGIILAAATAAVAAANVAQIASTSFAVGGYTGDGAPDQAAGIVHAGEVVIPNTRVREMGGPRYFIDRYRLPGYQSGGVVAPLAHTGTTTNEVRSQEVNVSFGVINTRQQMREFQMASGYKITVDQMNRRGNKINP